MTLDVIEEHSRGKAYAYTTSVTWWPDDDDDLSSSYFLVSTPRRSIIEWYLPVEIDFLSPRDRSKCHNTSSWEIDWNVNTWGIIISRARYYHSGDRKSRLPLNLRSNTEYSKARAYYSSCRYSRFVCVHINAHAHQFYVLSRSWIWRQSWYDIMRSVVRWILAR